MSNVLHNSRGSMFSRFGDGWLVCIRTSEHETRGLLYHSIEPQVALPGRGLYLFISNQVFGVSDDNESGDSLLEQVLGEGGNAMMCGPSFSAEAVIDREVVSDATLKGGHSTLRIANKTLTLSSSGVRTQSYSGTTSTSPVSIYPL